MADPNALVSGYTKRGSQIIEKVDLDEAQAAESRPSVKAALTTVGAGSITTAMLLAGILLRSGALGAPAADTLPTAAAYIAAEEDAGAFPVGSSRDFTFINNVATHTMTVTTNTGWTLTGTMTVATATARHFKIIRTAAATCELISLGVATGP